MTLDLFQHQSGRDGARLTTDLRTTDVYTGFQCAGDCFLE